jgi:2-hydroxychromene-2-carboxylate isomerase
MPSPIEVRFIFGIRSRYSYLAATQIERLERETGARVSWHCVESGALMAAAGYRPFGGSPTSGQYQWPYRRQDAAAWAAYYGVPFREPAAPMADASRSSLACVAAERMGAAAPYARRLFARYFAEGRDPLDDAALAGEAAALGLDRREFESLLADPETERVHRASIDRARAAGAFGVPSFLLGDRLFWGNDRIPLLRQHIAQLKAEAG